MEYYEWSDSRLFRLATAGEGHRWDPETEEWVTTSAGTTYREISVEARPEYVSLTPEQAEEKYPGATSSTAVRTDEVEDWPFTVEEMGKIMSAFSSDYPISTFIEDQGFSSEQRPYVARFWRMLEEAEKDLPPGQSFSPPTEWN